MADARRNVVILMTDQQRGDCLGIEGRQGLETPNMDYLAASGARFTRAYSAAPTCIAARRTLMSGQSPARHGLVGFVPGQEWEIAHTLPGELGKAGYQTQLIGNIHLFPQRKRYGFDHMVPPDDYRRWLKENTLRWEGGEMGHGVGGCDRTARPWHLAEWQHRTNWTVGEAIRFLEDRDSTCPFFLVVSFDAPHQPLTPPAFYFERYLRRELGEPVVGEWAPRVPAGAAGVAPFAWNVALAGEALREAYAGYYGLINHVDDQIGRFLMHLGELAGDTCVLFTADHGEMLGDHHMWRKRVPYEGSARVPFLLTGPGIPEGVVSDAPVGLEDVMPTVLEIAEVEVPETVEGRSVLELVRGEREGWREYFHGEHSETPSMEDKAGMHYLTDGKEKYVWMVSTGKEQLFDLVRDPKEMNDLAGDAGQAVRVARWRERLVQELAGRPEGFSDGKRLIAGRAYPTTLPHVHGVKGG